MRIGHNPARFVEKVDQPSGITVAVVNCIPFLSGYYEQSLEVLKVVVESLNATREEAHPYDVMVFDNHSCVDVRTYLKEASDDGKIQYLVLSDQNVGKIGAWNFMFGAAQGEYVVFSDGDIGFRPGWLRASLELFEAFPNVGMVTARPLKTPKVYSTMTFEWAQREKVLEEGRFLSRDVFLEHARSIERKEYVDNPNLPVNMSRVTFSGKVAYIGAAHFQFMARREILRKIIPLPSEQPMRGERALDIAINQSGLLRLMTEQALVWHMGNRLTSDVQVIKEPGRKSLLQSLLWLPGVRHFLLWLNNQIFRLYFFNVE
jgi:glycosyltransferase involved in cell wall biosynthesis